MLRRSPHVVIGRSGTTSAITSSTAPIVHSGMSLCRRGHLDTEEI
ncbi:hypothetical protein I553_3185 [Mycobacterium xenopi 4042]|uniref:Uncharacterized protein n=1 Tax=Mycobacterium xenopi 4042 TaxID=1299334 RepID=X8E5U9_MYCXE|nr:hypothetical protein I553_3185 [Mycobacterium xenopi 4042]